MGFSALTWYFFCGVLIFLFSVLLPSQQLLDTFWWTITPDFSQHGWLLWPGNCSIGPGTDVQYWCARDIIATCLSVGWSVCMLVPVCVSCVCVLSKKGGSSWLSSLISFCVLHIQSSLLPLSFVSEAEFDAQIQTLHLTKSKDTSIETWGVCLWYGPPGCPRELLGSDPSPSRPITSTCTNLGHSFGFFSPATDDSVDCWKRQRNRQQHSCNCATVAATSAPLNQDKCFPSKLGSCYLSQKFIKTLHRALSLSLSLTFSACVCVFSIK